MLILICAVCRQQAYETEQASRRLERNLRQIRRRANETVARKY